VTVSDPPLDAVPIAPAHAFPATFQARVVAEQPLGLQVAPAELQEPALHEAVSDPV
jgi:hypothetical protein